MTSLKKKESLSRLKRRLHSIPAFFWHFIVSYLSSKHDPRCSHFLINSFPISICHSVRALRRSLFQGKNFLGYNSSKQAWFTGLKVHILTTYRGHLKEFLITPASVHDLRAFQKMYLGTIPQGSTIFGDKAYTSQSLEEKLLFSKDILFLAERSANSKMRTEYDLPAVREKIRKRIEIAFSKLIS